MKNNEDNAGLEIVEPSAIELMERASIDVQITTAKKYPRELSRVKAQMLSFAMLDEDTAKACFYALRRKEADGGEKIITGPSVRLAEIALACYGHLRAGSRIIANDGKTITAQGVCHDLQNNVCVSIEVKRRITTKKGFTFSEDMQVVAGNAACAIALRNATFKVVPLALVKPVFEAAKRLAVGDGKTLASRRSAAVEHFNKLGISKERVFASVEVKGLDDIGLEQVEALIGMANAIRDGESSIDELFPTEPKKNLGDVLKGTGAGVETAATAAQLTPAAAPVADKPAPAAKAEVPAGDDVFARDDVMDQLKTLMLDHEVSESKLFEYARRLKEVPEGVDELFALPTAVLAKLKLAVPAVSTKKARAAAAG